MIDPILITKESIINQTQEQSTSPIKAVGMLSGGLDSTVAAKIVKDLGVDIYGVYFAMPWGCCDKTSAFQAAQNIGIKFITLQLDERCLEIVKNPKHGYGTALNPCVDCRIHMFKRAAQYMKHIGAEFVFTGEVLGQRPMSQQRKSMKWIEEESGLADKLLRPLCAHNMEPIRIEREGKVDRTKLLSITGRSRRPQYDLAEKHNITEFKRPGGGCLLTDNNFAIRMKDTLDHGYRNFRETIALKWGRHFRINNSFKVILGRDEQENLSLMRYAHKEDILMHDKDETGPVLILKGDSPPEDVLKTCAGLIQRYSKFKNDPSMAAYYYKASDKNTTFEIQSTILEESEIDKIRIEYAYDPENPKPFKNS